MIDTEALSRRYRRQSINLKDKTLLMTNFRNSEQEKDLQCPANCHGYGRIRHFTKKDKKGSVAWPDNPLPIEPAKKALKIPETGEIRAQVFQNAACNWRCWYCYVPFDLLSANRERSGWLTVSRLVDYYLEQDDPPKIIDLSGGQPDLVPEWVPWFMSEIMSRNLESEVYLWSDDNLSNDYFWRYLTKPDIDLVRSYKNYGRACCFKGFDAESFSFNTAAEPDLFHRQFELMKKLLALGIDIYAYVTLTCQNSADIGEKISHFIDRLQKLDQSLPLKTIPLQITMYQTVRSRVTDPVTSVLENQQTAVKCWNDELKSRFSKQERSRTICDFRMGVA